LKINEEIITKINFLGKGGKEQEILTCFQNKLVRRNGVLFDCQELDTGDKYELKKQRDLQWFDPRKFFNLSKEDREIIIVLLLIEATGYCDMIATIKLGDFVDRAFDVEQLHDASNYAKKYPKDQIKSGINVREFIKNNLNVVKIIWKK